MNKNAYIMASIVVAALILVGFLFFGRKKETTSQPNQDIMISQEAIPTVADSTQAGKEASGSMKKEETVVTYTDKGFSPATVTVKAGTSVKFLNSGKKMWIASAPHPTHTDLPGFDQLKAVGKGEAYSFVFDKVGVWKYHNHIVPADRGVVVVE